MSQENQDEIVAVETAEEPGPNRAQRRAERFHRHAGGITKLVPVRPAPVRVSR